MVPAKEWRRETLRRPPQGDFGESLQNGGPPLPRRRVTPRMQEKSFPQCTAFFTSEPILASSVAVNAFSAKPTGHIAPSSRFALSLKPSVAYLVLNFWALWKKQTTLSSLAYAGIPYHSLGERAGELSLIIV